MECAKYEGSLPEYDINEDGIMVLCRACNRYLDLLVGRAKNDNSLTSDERIMSELMSGKMQEPIRTIMNYLQDNQSITTVKGKELTGKSAAQVRRYLKALCDIGVIASDNTTKGNIYTKL